MTQRGSVPIVPTPATLTTNALLLADVGCLLHSVMKRLQESTITELWTKFVQQYFNEEEEDYAELLVRRRFAVPLGRDIVILCGSLNYITVKGEDVYYCPSPPNQFASVPETYRICVDYDSDEREDDTTRHAWLATRTEFHVAAIIWYTLAILDKQGDPQYHKVPQLVDCLQHTWLAKKHWSCAVTSMFPKIGSLIGFFKKHERVVKWKSTNNGDVLVMRAHSYPPMELSNKLLSAQIIPISGSFPTTNLPLLSCDDLEIHPNALVLKDISDLTKYFSAISLNPVVKNPAVKHEGTNTTPNTTTNTTATINTTATNNNKCKTVKEEKPDKMGVEPAVQTKVEPKLPKIKTEDPLIPILSPTGIPNTTTKTQPTSANSGGRNNTTKGKGTDKSGGWRGTQKGKGTGEAGGSWGGTDGSWGEKVGWHATAKGKGTSEPAVGWHATAKGKGTSEPAGGSWGGTTDSWGERDVAKTTTTTTTAGKATNSSSGGWRGTHKGRGTGEPGVINTDWGEPIDSKPIPEGWGEESLDTGKGRKSEHNPKKRNYGW